MSRKKVEISSRGANQIRAGGLWVFANEFVTRIKDLKPGEWVDFEKQGEFVGYGYVNPHSLIAGRICLKQPVLDRSEVFETLLIQAFEKRKNLRDSGSFRLVFSESDNLPGLIIDIYNDVAVAQLNTLGMDEAKDDIICSLKKILPLKGLVIKADSTMRALEGAKTYVDVVIGDKEDLQNGKVREYETFFAADFVGGQKTGFFLDQRGNRQHLKGLAKDKRVLDLCCYSGGWGVSALVGGAASVTFVDQSQEALKLVKRSLELNGVPLSKSKLVCEDVFDYLERDKEKFDIVICDPPAFVKSKKNLPQATKAYKKLNKLALAKVKGGGILYSCSCSFHLLEHEFEELLKVTLQESGRIGQIIHRGGQGLDHPWVLNRPESRYLKCYGLHVD